ncbi:hypothetical protein D1AOALGA4SA_4176 [Olavius algarvensis Delta 1 endosymbiont]|nr:hypothetical protein D1AOALGA4SA_4176 [Olavius algarvensis Delta 1 endosymbiont]
MRIVCFCLLSTLMIPTACSTLEHDRIKSHSSSWYGSEVLNIPYGARMSQFEKGNLVANPSFEDRSAVVIPGRRSREISGWEKIGPNVSWVDHEAAGFTTKDVMSGRHAVKIFRENANELDEAEGIISDFIAVMPGNYYFSYHVRLENVASNKHRLGVQLYDAIEIKTLYFDEDKRPIDPGILNPVSKSLIDNSDKGYSFSNYWAIDEFPWAEVRGRTYNYPFSEGDIPKGTRYVRLFLGLKGTGAMWIDDVVYRYSKWNFTALERMKPYLARPLALKERILPTPKNFQHIDDIVFYDSALPNFHPPLIVLPQNSVSADVTAAKTLQEKISQVLGRVMPAPEFDSNPTRILKNDYSLNDILKARLVFSIGNNQVYQDLQPRLPPAAVREKPQGYVIKAIQTGQTRIVFLIGDSPLGRYYAATTAIQLFETDRAVYHNATVVDLPDFLGRSYTFKNWTNDTQLKNDLDSMPRLSRYKLNKVYAGFNRRGAQWFQLDDLYFRGIVDAGRWCRDSGVMTLAMMVNPYSHLGFEPPIQDLSDQLRYSWTHSNPQSLEILKEIYKPALTAGAETIMLLADDSVPHTGNNRKNYSLYTAEDKNRFGTLQNAQAHIINGLKQWIESDYPGTRLEFCPPWYANEHIDRSNGKAENYFSDLIFQIPPDVAIIWTGPTVRSLSVDMADLFRYKALIGRWPMMWDNTLYARSLESPSSGGYPAHYPGKVRLCNLFEPYDTLRPQGFHKYSDGRQMYTKGAAYSEVYKIKYATVADYQWNTAAYNPELALWKALTNAYGRKAAEQLLHFNDAYYSVYEICLGLQAGGNNPQSVEKAETVIVEMHESLTAISALAPGQTRLLNELRQFLKKQEERLAAIVSGL